LETVVGFGYFGAIGYGIYWWMKKRQTKKIEEEIYKTPIEKATSLLNVLEKNSFGKKEEVKEYYSELTDIARITLKKRLDPGDGKHNIRTS
jgi:hypothetical protein